MLVSVLASGSKGNVTLIKSGVSILIDLGMNYKYIEEALSKYDLTPQDIDYVLLTHSHTDHTGALKQFLKVNHPLVFVSNETYNEIEDLKNYDNLCFDDSPYKDSYVTIDPFHTSHDAAGSRGYIVSNENESFVYITDTGYINQKLFDKLSNHTYYEFESNHDIELLMHGRYPSWLKQRVSSDKGHLSNQQAAFYLSKLIGESTKQVCLAHLSEENNDPELALNNVLEYFKDNNLSFNNFKCCKQKEIVEVCHD